MTALEQLKKVTIVVADTGDFNLVGKYQPQDVTTNPSLLLALAERPEYAHLLTEAVDAVLAQEKAKGHKEGEGSAEKEDRRVQEAVDLLTVKVGCELLERCPGRVSTEIDASLSFDTAATVTKAHALAALYTARGVDIKKRVLFKIASTWEGLEAARQLEKEGMHVNMTLLFSLCQAARAGEVGATLISPFAGRITDFFKEKLKVSQFEPATDPGVVSVKNIYNYLKTYGYSTVVMGASFRTKEQVLELAGCDLLTISPNLLEDLKNTTNVEVVKKLNAQDAKTTIPKMNLTEQEFRWMFNEDEMATVKLAEGIRKFNADTVKLKSVIKKAFASKQA